MTGTLTRLWHWLIGTPPGSPVYDRPYRPYVCGLCERGHHVHDANGGQCIDRACDCGGAP